MNDCVKRNFEYFYEKKGIFKEYEQKDRLNTLKKFIGKSESVIDIGSGGFMPKLLKVNYACDNTKLSFKYLNKLNWKGEFKVADLSKKLPYENKQFNIAICSEVIEHLRNKKSILNAFNEINRISKKWIVTTPSVIIKDKDHKFFFHSGNLFNFIPFELGYYTVIQKGIFYYISNDINKLKKVTNAK